jgi:DNA polymerase-3 subunit epsilon
MLIPDEYIIFDLETTGLSPQYAEIIEIGAIKVRDGIKSGTFHTYVKPLKGIPSKITALTGITERDTCNAPCIAQALSAFASFTKGAVLIAHNSSFDCRFLAAACCMTGTVLDNSVLDSLQMARAYIKGLPNYKLETLKNYFCIDLPSHNALDDCAVTVKVVEYCRNKQNSLKQ